MRSDDIPLMLSKEEAREILLLLQSQDIQQK